ncbi:MAG: membrane protein insertase YidC [Saprospiraceae bacterium]
MERNQIIGLILIFTTLLVWTFMNKPSSEELAKRQHQRDSIALAEQVVSTTSDTVTKVIAPTTDSVKLAQNSSIFGIFAPASVGTNEKFVLENDEIKIVFDSKGGRISSAILKKHYKTVQDSAGKDAKELISIMDNEANRFEYLLTLANNSTVQTSQLYFTAEKQGNSLIFKATIDANRYFEQKYTLQPDSYTLDYSIQTKGLSAILSPAPNAVKLYWENHLNKFEKGEQFEQNYSTAYFREVDESTDYCKCVSDDTKELTEKGIQWISHSNQFFNTTLISESKAFGPTTLTTKMTDLKKSNEVKVITSDITIPLTNEKHDMVLYIGPNEYDRLASFGNKMEEIIPFGSSIFGTINRWVIRPFFDFLSQFIGNKGIVILVLIFLIKMLLYPLMYKMLHSQSKMGALKPELAQLKEKYKDDTQKQQMETMKIYREYGVSPFGGCMPMILQMPIWYALFRFFPASITFRQEPFLWAPDLSTYDVFFDHGVDIPFMGTHISLFTLLWAASTIMYTYYNMQNVDLSANPAMKYIQYLMPVMFLGFFNSYASGLTAYMFFSNLINILQTVITKKYVFDETKIRAELMKEKAKPKKKSGFQARLEDAMKQQQAAQEQKKKKNK